jgi:rubrerythrin
LFFRKKQNNEKKKERAYELLEEIDKQSVAQPVIIRREIVKEEVKMVKCLYCSGLMKPTSIKCPNCGAPRKE